MAKVRLELGAELDLLSKRELSDALEQQGGWQREAAFGLRHQGLPRMLGFTDGSGNLNLGADQPDQVFCGPDSGWYWAVKRISVDGLATSEAVKVYKDQVFVCWIQQTPGFQTFGKDGLLLKPGEFLRVTGTGLTHNEQITVTGDAISAPGPLMWKLIG